MGRATVFILTFFTYSVLHMMRTTYSFNKHTFQKVFGIDDMFLGIVDSTIYLTLSLGILLRYSILNSKKPTNACLLTAIPVTIGFSIIPIISLLKNDQNQQSWIWYLVIILSFGFFGFFQLSFFPATLTIFSSHFNVKNDGKWVGIWSSKSNVGNIMGFFMANILIYVLNIRWEYTMLLCSILLLILCTLLYVFVKNPQFESDQQITTGQFFRFVKKTLSTTQFKLYIISFSLFKAILYSYELWTPKFLDDAGYQQYSGYVPMLFDIATLFGSFFMGLIYQSQAKQQKLNNQKAGFLKKYKFFIPALLVTIICVLYVFTPGTLTLYVILGASMGLFLGAIYNSLQNNEVMNYTNNEPTKTDMFSTLNIGLGCAMVGLTQFIIGLVLNVGEDIDHDHDPEQRHQTIQIYITIGVLAVIASVLIFLKSTYKKKQPQASLIQTQEQNVDIVYSQRQQK